MQSIKEITNPELDMANQLLAGVFNADFDKLQELMLEQEQAPCPIHHFFGGGVCIRQLYAAKGTLLIGKKHKFPHMNMMVSGRILFLCEDGTTEEVSAPFFCSVGPGRKIAYVLEDMIWQNIFPTELTDADSVELFFLEDEPIKKIELVDTNKTFENIKKVSNYNGERIIDEPSPPNLRIADSSIHGKGLFLTFPAKVGEVICELKYGQHWLKIIDYINHSEVPNCVIVSDYDREYLMATKNLKGALGGQVGTELTVNYRDRSDIWKVKDGSH